MRATSASPSPPASWGSPPSEESFARTSVPGPTLGAATNDALSREIAGDAPGAVAILERVVEENSEDGPSWLRLGRALRRDSRTEDSRAALARAAELAPEKAVVHYELAKSSDRVRRRGGSGYGAASRAAREAGPCGRVGAARRNRRFARRCAARARMARAAPIISRAPNGIVCSISRFSIPCVMFRSSARLVQERRIPGFAREIEL